MKTALSQKISLLLKQKNLTINEFEKNSGLGKSAVSNIIHGRSKSPSIEIINIIAKNLACTMEYLISEPTINNNTTNDAKIRYRLCAEASMRLAEYLENTSTKLSVEDFFKCAIDIYKFTEESGQNYIDVRFVQWSAKRYAASAHVEK